MYKILILIVGFFSVFAKAIESSPDPASCKDWLEYLGYQLDAEIYRQQGHEVPPALKRRIQHLSREISENVSETPKTNDSKPEPQEVRPKDSDLFEPPSDLFLPTQDWSPDVQDWTPESDAARADSKPSRAESEFQIYSDLEQVLYSKAAGGSAPEATDAVFRRILANKLLESPRFTGHRLLAGHESEVRLLAVEIWFREVSRTNTDWPPVEKLFDVTQLLDRPTREVLSELAKSRKSRSASFARAIAQHLADSRFFESEEKLIMDLTDFYLTNQRYSIGSFGKLLVWYISCHDPLHGILDKESLRTYLNSSQRE